jgi:hypothetical protein
MILYTTFDHDRGYIINYINDTIYMYLIINLTHTIVLGHYVGCKLLSALPPCIWLGVGELLHRVNIDDTRNRRECAYGGFNRFMVHVWVYVGLSTQLLTILSFWMTTQFPNKDYTSICQ